MSFLHESPTQLITRPDSSVAVTTRQRLHLIRSPMVFPVSCTPDLRSSSVRIWTRENARHDVPTRPSTRESSTSVQVRSTHRVGRVCTASQVKFSRTLTKRMCPCLHKRNRLQREYAVNTENNVRPRSIHGTSRPEFDGDLTDTCPITMKTTGAAPWRPFNRVYNSPR